MYLSMKDAYEKGISPMEWRRCNYADTLFLKKLSNEGTMKQIRINNQEKLLRELGF